MVVLTSGFEQPSLHSPYCQTLRTEIKMKKTILTTVLSLIKCINIPVQELLMHPFIIASSVVD